MVLKMAAPPNGVQPVKKTQPALADVLTLTPMCGKLFVLKKVGDEVQARPTRKPVPKPPGAPSVVIPFPARGSR
ncbi:hypothetical protein B9Y80_12715 [Stenotrophomonas maltophilia]|nr:hypothetical protein B9Y80_12715 [Stenotrophomonas maltophilia]